GEEELKKEAMRNGCIIVATSRLYKQSTIVPRTIFCSSRNVRGIKLGEIVMTEGDLLMALKNMVFLTNGSDVFTLSEAGVELRSVIIRENKRPRTEFAPFFKPYLGAFAGPLFKHKTSPSPLELSTDFAKLSMLYFAKRDPALDETEEVALELLEEISGLRRGLRYEELLERARRKALEKLKERKIMPLLKMGNFVVANPLVSTDLFPELKKFELPKELEIDLPPDPIERLKIAGGD
ncbi:MAG: hypothetical protein NZ879_06325, partial [Archaeoglobaceae archaeon]|nr:hypothetical protein [Archaeoglobaceae archaeon]MDW8118582.1 hypothetical protein [Archaeoglobaceae archaeon]